MKSIFKIFLPTLFAYIMFALTNIIDAIFVGNLYGITGQSAMGLANPIIILLNCIIFSIIIGTNTFLGHAIGQKDENKVNKIFNHNLFYGIIILILIEFLLFIIIIPVSLNKIINHEILNYFIQYISIFLPSLILLYIITTLTFIRRLIGDINIIFKTGFITIIVNIIFNYVFSIVLDFGMKGIAIASCLSFLTQIIYLYTIYKKDADPMFRLKFYKLDVKLILRTILNGLSDGIFDLSNALVQVINITLLTFFIGFLAPSYIYVLNSILMLQLIMFFSLSDSLNPLISVEYGKKNLTKIKSIRNNALIVSIILGIIIYFIIFLIKPILLTLFGIIDTSSRDYLLNYSNLYFLVIFVFGINQTFIAYLTAIGWSKLSLILGVLRNIIFIICITFIMTFLFGEIGLWISYFISELISLIFIVFILVWIRPLKKEYISLNQKSK